MFFVIQMNKSGITYKNLALTSKSLLFSKNSLLIPIIFATTANFLSHNELQDFFAFDLKKAFYIHPFSLFKDRAKADFFPAHLFFQCTGILYFIQLTIQNLKFY